MDYLHQNLHWLTDPPDNLRERCKSLLASDKNTVRELKDITSSNLDLNQLLLLSDTITSLQQNGKDLSNLTRFKLGILGNGTLSYFSKAIVATAARYGISLIVVETDYNQVLQEALNPQSKINTADLDAVLLALDFHDLPLSDAHSSNAPIEHIKNIREALNQQNKTPVIFQTFVCPPERLFGSFDIKSAESISCKIHCLNRFLARFSDELNDYILDVEAVANMVGVQQWQSTMHWNQFKLPVAEGMLPIYAEHLARLLSAICGKSRKCLVLDLDNTLWGGVVGDDGLEGIKIGQGNAIGEAYLEVQNAALALRDRGIILAVSSKNEDATARSPFREHPDMLLKEEHFSVFKANWKDKASNIEMIANELNIGLDSIVFFDDNPAERMQVRAQLPEVAVPELPSDVSLYARTLLNAGYFDVVGISEEDKQRASQYQANKQRGELLSQAHDLGAFLLSLEMKVDASHFLKISVRRVTQLINKTNQFNLTTKRYTESGIEELMKKPNFITLQVRLSDRFGDNGIISIGICEIKGDVCEIDTWLMSCRVFGRRVEEFQLAELVRLAESKGAKQLVGKYIPTQKNVIVSGLYERLGFEKIASDENGSTWTFNIDDYRHNDLPFRQS